MFATLNLSKFYLDLLQVGLKKPGVRPNFPSYLCDENTENNRVLNLAGKFPIYAIRISSKSLLIGPLKHQISFSISLSQYQHKTLSRTPQIQ